MVNWTRPSPAAGSPSFSTLIQRVIEPPDAIAVVPRSPGPSSPTRLSIRSPRHANDFMPGLKSGRCAGASPRRGCGIPALAAERVDRRGRARPLANAIGPTTLPGRRTATMFAHCTAILQDVHPRPATVARPAHIEVLEALVPVPPPGACYALLSPTLASRSATDATQCQPSSVIANRS